MTKIEKIKFLSEVEIPNPVGAAYYAIEAEKASGYTKGGETDKVIKELTHRIAALEAQIVALANK